MTLLSPSITPSKSISSRLLRLNLLVTVTALVLAVIAFFSYDLITYKQDLILSLSAEARIAGSNSVSALLFNDKQTAQGTLSALGSSADVMGAAIVTNDGKVFAQYLRQPDVVLEFPPLSPGRMQQHWSSASQVLLAERIVYQGKSEGTVYIAARLQELEHRAIQFLIIAAIVFLICLVVAMLVAASFRRTVTKPIIALATMLREVTRDRNYSLRAPPSDDGGEIAILIDSSNDMLAQIEQRELALRQTRDELESRVQERTAELKTANRELEAFSYTVAHDLRGPLDAIGSIGYILQQGYADKLDDEGKEMLDKLRQSSTKMADLIDDLLNLSRAGTSALERSNVDLSRMVTEIAEELRTAEPERNVYFWIAPDAIALADAALVKVALENLIRNAWKYTSQRLSGRIEFSFRRTGEHVTYFVRDNGAGFNPELTDRLFKPFQRLHTQGEFAGTGVGLATVQRIIARHGGRVWAEGAVNQGATFYFTLEG